MKKQLGNFSNKKLDIQLNLILNLNSIRDRRFWFEKNSEKINNHNKIEGSKYKLGVNHLAHISHDEFSSIFLGMVPPENVRKPDSNTKSDDESSKFEYPKSFGNIF
jgi:hypothetical protein